MKPIKRELYFDPKLKRLRPIEGELLTTSSHLDWRGFLLEHHTIPPSEGQDVVWMNNVVVVQLREAVTIESKEGSHSSTQRILPGQIRIRPAFVPYSCRTLSASEFVTVSLEPGFLQSVSSGKVAPQKWALNFLSGVEDRFVEGVCMALLGEAQQGGRSGKLYSESLATSLAAHLLSHYSNQVQDNTVKGGLTQRSLRNALEYIHEHLNENISLKTIADAAGLSQFHFARQFKSKMGCPPYQFVLQKRIERAKELLLRRDLSISAIASDLGFSDQSHLTLHFKRLTGSTPRAFAKRFDSE